jgi:predicted transcriptional regulator
MRSKIESLEASRNSTYSDTLEQGLSIDNICQVQKRRTHRSYKRHRSKEEIIANILTAARKNATKTRIMRGAYISYNLLQKYLSRASVSGLLLYDHRSNQYQITSKGMQYLDYFNQYRDTETDLVLKKSMISKMLENDIEESMSLSRKMEEKVC